MSGKYDSKNVGPSGSRPTTCLEMEKPASMPQVQYSGLSKSEKRQLTDPKGRDGFIQIEGYPRLNIDNSIKIRIKNYKNLPLG